MLQIQITTTTTITFADVPDAAPPAAADQATAAAADLSGALDRLYRAVRSPHLLELAAALDRMGYSLLPPKRGRENYLRVLPGPTGRGVGYLKPNSLEFSLGAAREMLAAMPGARVYTAGVAFLHTGGAGEALAAARAVRDLIDPPAA
jgi:hypothetical protein